MCAPSNVAVDGILERLVAAEDGSGSGSGGGGRKSGDRLCVARMGHPARLLPQVGLGDGGTRKHVRFAELIKLGVGWWLFRHSW